MKKTSEKFNLDWADLGKGLIVAVLSAVITALYQIVSTGAFPTLQDLKAVGLIGLTAGLGYLVKNYFSPSQTITSMVIMGLMVAGLTSCSFTRQAQDYVTKHCPKTYVADPSTGNLVVHYECDSLWKNDKLNDKCKRMSICIDAVNGKITGDVECNDLVDVPKLKALPISKQK